MIVTLLDRLVPVGTAVGRVGFRVARAWTVSMSGRLLELSRDAVRGLSPQDLVPGDVLLARTTPRPLTGNHGSGSNRRQGRSRPTSAGVSGANTKLISRSPLFLSRCRHVVACNNRGRGSRFAGSAASR